MESTIQVNFNRPLPLFPLADVVLLPHSVQHLHIFEKRYRQMLSDCLDGPGQFAVASFAESGADEHEHPPLRPIACVGQIMHHHQFPDGRYNVILLGICRARIIEITEPDGKRLYRTARMDLHEQPVDDAELSDVRERLHDLIKRPRLGAVRGIGKVQPFFEKDEVPTHALLELLGSTVVEDPTLRYELLAESSARGRATLLDKELKSIDRLVQSAEWQFETEWPKGMSWN